MQNRRPKPKPPATRSAPDLSSDLPVLQDVAPLFRERAIVIHDQLLEALSLRGSQIEGLKIGAGDLYGAIVDPAQVMQFAALLGLKIR